MEHATHPGPAAEESGAARPRIPGCMDGGDQEIKPQSPVCQPSEVAERLADGAAVPVGTVPRPDDDDGCEDVEGDQRAQTREDGGGQEPRGLEEMTIIVCWVDAEEGRVWDAAHGFFGISVEGKTRTQKDNRVLL